MKTLLSLFCSLVVCTLSLGQTNSTTDLTGRWHGTYTYLNKNYPMVIEFTQTDQKLSGTIFTHKKDSTQYASFTFEGSLKKSKVALKALKFLETKGLWCLPTYDLTLISINEQQMLEGRWKPNFHKNGCLIGVSGRMSIIKEQEIIAQPSNSVVQTNTNEEDDEHDAYTKGMIEGLKVREYHALIIGVNQYNDEDITDLDNPISDGQKLSNTLESFYNFKKENITFLKSPGRTEILDEMEKLSKELDDKDNLLIFYGGHGIWDEALEQGYWLPADATIDSKSKWISNSTIRDYIRSINTRHTLLISDACFSGGLLKQRGVGKALINVYK
ncbi:MAG: caspase family protein, partial [Bacteroidota bacterium]